MMAAANNDMCVCVVGCGCCCDCDWEEEIQRRISQSTEGKKERGGENRSFANPLSSQCGGGKRGERHQRCNCRAASPSEDQTNDGQTGRLGEHEKVLFRIPLRPGGAGKNRTGEGRASEVKERRGSHKQVKRTPVPRNTDISFRSDEQIPSLTPLHVAFASTSSFYSRYRILGLSPCDSNIGL